MHDSAKNTTRNFSPCESFQKQDPANKDDYLQTCDKCGVVLKGIGTLRHHMKAIHNNDRQHKCDEPGCDKAFVDAHQLKK